MDLGDHRSCSGYCPGPRVPYYTDGMSSRWLLGWSVGFVLSVLERSVRSERCASERSRGADDGLHDSRAGSAIAPPPFVDGSHLIVALVRPRL